MTAFRISPLWWPVMALASPVILPFLFKKNKKYKENLDRVNQQNKERMNKASALELPELDYLELTVVVEEKSEHGFLGDAGVSYLFKSNLGSLLFDVGFGPDRPAFGHNAEKLGLDVSQIDGIAISHLHPDHMGGIAATRKKQVIVPGAKPGQSELRPCFLPDKASSPHFSSRLLNAPGLLTAGIASTGPLARSLFFFGLTQEQALVAKVKGKGLVVFTGCGHPTVEVIMDMVSKMSNEPVYAFGGGLHFPITNGRGNRAGIKVQMIIGTGKPPWQRITEKDMDQTIETLNRIGPEKILLSAHDSCDEAIKIMEEKLNCGVQLLRAGATYRF